MIVNTNLKITKTILLTILLSGFLLLLNACSSSESKYKTNVSLEIPTPPPCTIVGQIWISPRDGMELLCVPKGEFTMGDDAEDREKPVHKVLLNAFWMDKTEVTNEMFSKFVESRDYKTWSQTKRNNRSYVFSEDPNIIWIDMQGANWKIPEGANSSIKGRENYPVVHIHKDDAITYCNWAGRRLPTEAEWEKAARGSDGRKFPWGNEKVQSDFANIADKNLPMVKWADISLDDGYRYTAPVGSFPKGSSPYGVMDMAGNVWEIVNDWANWEYYANSPYENPLGPAKSAEKQLPVIRGGSWYSNAWEIRATHRTMPDPNKSSVVVGFRCAASSK